MDFPLQRYAWTCNSIKYNGRNPYFSGLSFATVNETDQFKTLIEVAILILVDFPLQQFEAVKNEVGSN